MSEKICVTGYGQTVYFKKPAFDYAQMCIGSDNLIHGQVLNTNQDKWKLKKWNKQTGKVVGSGRNTASYFDLVPIANEVSKFSVGDEVLWGDYIGKIKKLSIFSKIYSTYLVSFPDHRDMCLGDDVLVLVPAKKEIVESDGKLSATQYSPNEVGFKSGIKELKKKYATGKYDCYYKMSDDAPVWERLINPHLDDKFSEYKLILKEHSHIADAVIANPDVEVEFSHYKDAIKFPVVASCFFESYSENVFYYIKYKQASEDIFTVTEDKSFVVGSQYKHLKCDTVKWSKQNHTLDQQKAICQFMINKYSMREKGQDAEDIIKIKFYVEWLEQIAKS